MIIAVDTVERSPIILGKVGATYGVRGWVRITSFTQKIEAIFEYSPWQIKENGVWQPVIVRQWRHQGKSVIASLDGVTSLERAADLTHSLIAVEPKLLSELPTDEFYWHQLIGCQVITEAGVTLGSVESLIPTGANDVLVVSCEDDMDSVTDNILIPYVDAHVINVDADNKVITVNWDSGWLKE